MQATDAPDDTRHLQLEGALSIYTAADTKLRLCAALQGAIRLQIGLSAVDEFDCAGLQLLLATREQARRQDIDLQFNAGSAAVMELLTLSAIDDLLATEEVH
ncbi:Anti-sigma factor antagonist [Pseudomonas sp. 8Z]|uniref:STAS domain-containing protein n=1 Tax=Pseudomonas sp. 8Z TaxID=2653166 RepID=UPI0012F02586|nr:STAS domain-containing protein [Pseudomonas sp. 8Z]VXC96430.1 Anti-sigma factor antagonist [Pseudomonas sp. 8Z]